jgi:hypothetical protein
MTKSISASAKRRGRPITTGTGMTIGVRMLDDRIAVLDAWIKKQNDVDLSRPEAIRRLVELGLKAHTPEPKAVGLLRKRVAGAAELAAKAVDILTVGIADADEKASRKRRLKAKGK